MHPPCAHHHLLELFVTSCLPVTLCTAMPDCRRTLRLPPAAPKVASTSAFVAPCALRQRTRERGAWQWRPMQPMPIYLFQRMAMYIVMAVVEVIPDAVRRRKTPAGGQPGGMSTGRSPPKEGRDGMRRTARRKTEAGGKLGVWTGRDPAIPAIRLPEEGRDDVRTAMRAAAGGKLGMRTVIGTVAGMQGGSLRRGERGETGTPVVVHSAHLREEAAERKRSLGH